MKIEHTHMKTELLSERERTAKSRAYRMRERADHVRQTRERIVKATVHLHGTIGFAATTVAGIARQAGVTRLTVYRHFPDIDSLYAACSAHWRSLQVPPDPHTWARVADPTDRLRFGLADLYRFYRGGEAMLTFVDREREMLSDEIRRANERTSARLRDTLLEPFDARGAQRRRLRSLLGHAVSFTTWRSLCVEHGLTDREAVEAMTTLVTGRLAPAPAVRAPARLPGPQPETNRGAATPG
jgi:AcrR family transcriptional regulator